MRIFSTRPTIGISIIRAIIATWLVGEPSAAQRFTFELTQERGLCLRAVESVRWVRYDREAEGRNVCPDALRLDARPDGTLAGEYRTEAGRIPVHCHPATPAESAAAAAAAAR